MSEISGNRTFSSASARALAVAAKRRSLCTTPNRSTFGYGIGGRTTPINRSLQSSQIFEHSSGQFVVENYGCSLPALVMEALTFSDRNTEISAVLSPIGWAWLVAGRKLMVWRYRTEGNKRIANHQFRELTLPSSDLAHKAQLVNVFCHSEGQVPSCVAVSPEGFVRYWPNMSHEGSVFEATTDLQGQECDTLLHLNASLGSILSTTTSAILRIQPVPSSVAQNQLIIHLLKPPAGILGGISRRVSSLVFGSMPSQSPEARLVGVACLDSGASHDEKNVIVLSARTLQKWKFLHNQPEKLIYEHNVDKIIQESIVDNVWGRVRIGAQFEMWLIAIQPIGNTGSIMILTASMNSEISQHLVYSLVTLDTSSSVPPQNASGFCALKSDEFHFPAHTDSSFLSQKFILYGSNAFIYSKQGVICVPVSPYEDAENVEFLDFSNDGDLVLGVGKSTKSPLIFSANNGILSILSNQCSILNESAMTNDTIMDLSNMTFVVGSVNATEIVSKLRAAFLQYNRNNVAQAQSILDELFPNGETLGLDTAVAQLSSLLLDDIPGADPRWAESNQPQANQQPSTTTSLIIANQLKDKILAHQYFILFLVKMGLWQRLGIVLLESDRRVHTRILLAEHCELLQIAASLKSIHQDHQELVDHAIRLILSEREESPKNQLSYSDIFYRSITKISDIVHGLNSALEKVISVDASPQDAAATVYNVNIVLLNIFKTARDTKISPTIGSSRHVQSETQIEYVPWNSSEGPLGIRNLLIKQHGTTVEVGLKTAQDGASRSKLYNQIVELSDEILSGIQPHLSSLAHTNNTRHQSLLEDYQNLRYKLLRPLVEGEQYNQAISMAEKFCDFRTLVEICEKTDDPLRLDQYMTKFGSQGFPDFVFRWYLETGKRGKLLSQGIGEQSNKALARFLQDYSSLAWIHQIDSRDFQSAHKTLKELALQETSFLSKKKTLLSLSKLCQVASGDQTSLEIDPRLSLEEDLVLYQEQLPEHVLESISVSPDDMRVFTPAELIHLYVDEENRTCSEFDFKKALDLLAWIQDPLEIEELKQLIWSRAILKDSWSDLNTDDPLESLNETVLFRTIDLAITQGCDLKEIMIDCEKLLDLPSLENLKRNSAFVFLIKAGYEKLNEIFGTDTSFTDA